jgi:hypothetical protein
MTKTAESNVEGIIGLEIMRTDLEHAGYGLPYALPFSATFEESQVANNSLANGINPTDFNDNKISSLVDATKVPLAIQGKAATGAGAWENGRDYIVIKSTLSGMNAAANKWSYIDGVGGTSTIYSWGNNDFVADERVITLNALTRALVATSSTDFSYQVTVSGTNLIPAAAYRPPNNTTRYLVYGVSSAVDLRVPYNRVDYYIKRPTDISPRCANGTGTLYKGVMSHGDGLVTNTEYPLFDCVADMQIFYGVDANTDDDINEVNFHGNENYFSTMSAENLRKQLKTIHVYILAHEGKKDKSYTYPSSTVQVGETINGTDYGRTYDLSLLDGIGSEWANYRWKLYKIVVTPRNL